MDFEDYAKVIRRSIDPYRNEYGCRNTLRVFVSRLMRKKTYPPWMQPLNFPAKKCFAGGYKQVYVYDNYAIAISRETMDVGSLKSKFEKINEKIPNSLNYPEETFKIGGYHVAKLRKCSDTLVDVLISGRQGWESQMVQLGGALRKLHNNNIVLSDIKPDNILVCGNTLSFGDIDDAYDLTESITYNRFTPPYNLKLYWDEYRTGPRSNPLEVKHMQFLDWYAFGYCVLLSCKQDGYNGVILRTAIDCINANIPFRMRLDETKYKKANIHPVVRTCCDWMLLSSGRYISPTPMAKFFKQKKKRAVTVFSYKWNLKY